MRLRPLVALAVSMLSAFSLGGVAHATAVPQAYTTAPAQSSSVLAQNASMYAGAALRNGPAVLTMQSDGNLVLYVSGVAKWSTGTGGNPGAYAVMQSDGNFVVYLGGTPLWNSGTGGTNATYVSLSQTGAWSLDNSYGSSLYSVNPSTFPLYGGAAISAGPAKLVMQVDGNLVVYVSGSAIWSSGTAGHPGAWAVMQSDGNLVIYTQGGPIWATWTNGTGASYVSLTSNGTFILGNNVGSAEWAGRTYQTPAGLIQLMSSNVPYAGTQGANIQPYMNGYRVFLVQNKLGIHFSGELTGMYVGGTYAAVTAWQNANGFPANGVITQAQWIAMGFSASSWFSDDNSDHPLWNDPTTMIRSSRQSLVNDMIAAAQSYVGNTQFVTGASMQAGNGADCSGLIMQALYAVGINPLPSSSWRHTQNGYDYESRYLWANPGFEHVSSPQPGDLVFYAEGGVVYHTALYIGNGWVAESWAGAGVRTAPIITAAFAHRHIIGYARPLP